MSRLYIEAQGSRSPVTRTATNHAEATIFYNFDGGNLPIGGMRLEAEVSPDKTKVTYVLYYFSVATGGKQEVGRWDVDEKTFLLHDSK